MTTTNQQIIDMPLSATESTVADIRGTPGIVFGNNPCKFCDFNAKQAFCSKNKDFCSDKSDDTRKCCECGVVEDEGDDCCGQDDCEGCGRFFCEGLKLFINNSCGKVFFFNNVVTDNIEDWFEENGIETIVSNNLNSCEWGCACDFDHYKVSEMKEYPNEVECWQYQTITTPNSGWKIEKEE
jgi:hypothetical protein